MIFQNILHDFDDMLNTKKLNYLLFNLKTKYSDNFCNCKFLFSLSESFSSATKNLNILCFKSSNDFFVFEEFFNMNYIKYLDTIGLQSIKFYKSNYIQNFPEEKINIKIKQEKISKNQFLNSVNKKGEIYEDQIGNHINQYRNTLFKFDKFTNVISFTHNQDNLTEILILSFFANQIKNCNIELANKSITFFSSLQKEIFNSSLKFNSNSINSYCLKMIISENYVEESNLIICSDSPNQIQSKMQVMLIKYLLMNKCYNKSNNNELSNLFNSQESSSDKPINENELIDQLGKNISIIDERENLNVFILCMNEIKVDNCICRNYPNSVVCQKSYCQKNPKNFECSRNHCDLEPNDLEACECKNFPNSKNCRCKLNPYSKACEEKEHSEISTSIVNKDFNNKSNKINHLEENNPKYYNLKNLLMDFKKNINKKKDFKYKRQKPKFPKLSNKEFDVKLDDSNSYENKFSKSLIQDYKKNENLKSEKINIDLTKKDVLNINGESSKVKEKQNEDSEKNETDNLHTKKNLKKEIYLKKFFNQPKPEIDIKKIEKEIIKQILKKYDLKPKRSKNEISFELSSLVYHNSTKPELQKNHSIQINRVPEFQKDQKFTINNTKIIHINLFPNKKYQNFNQNKNVNRKNPENKIIKEVLKSSGKTEVIKNSKKFSTTEEQKNKKIIINPLEKNIKIHDYLSNLKDKSLLKILEELKQLKETSNIHNQNQKEENSFFQNKKQVNTSEDRNIIDNINKIDSKLTLHDNIQKDEKSILDNRSVLINKEKYDPLINNNITINEKQSNKFPKKSDNKQISFSLKKKMNNDLDDSNILYSYSNNNAHKIDDISLYNYIKKEIDKLLYLNVLENRNNTQSRNFVINVYNIKNGNSSNQINDSIKMKLEKLQNYPLKKLDNTKVNIKKDLIQINKTNETEMKTTKLELMQSDLTTKIDNKKTKNNINKKILNLIQKLINKIDTLKASKFMKKGPISKRRVDNKLYNPLLNITNINNNNYDKTSLRQKIAKSPMKIIEKINTRNINNYFNFTNKLKQNNIFENRIISEKKEIINNQILKEFKISILLKNLTSTLSSILKSPNYFTEKSNNKTIIYKKANKKLDNKIKDIYKKPEENFIKEKKSQSFFYPLDNRNKIHIKKSNSLNESLSQEKDEIQKKINNENKKGFLISDDITENHTRNISKEFNLKSKTCNKKTLKNRFLIGSKIMTKNIAKNLTDIDKGFLISDDLIKNYAGNILNNTISNKKSCNKRKILKNKFSIGSQFTFNITKNKKGFLISSDLIENDLIKHNHYGKASIGQILENKSYKRKKLKENKFLVGSKIINKCIKKNSTDKEKGFIISDEIIENKFKIGSNKTISNNLDWKTRIMKQNQFKIGSEIINKIQEGNFSDIGFILSNDIIEHHSRNFSNKETFKNKSCNKIKMRENKFLVGSKIIGKKEGRNNLENKKGIFISDDIIKHQNNNVFKKKISKTNTYNKIKLNDNQFLTGSNIFTNFQARNFSKYKKGFLISNDIIENHKSKILSDLNSINKYCLSNKLKKKKFKILSKKGHLNKLRHFEIGKNHSFKNKDKFNTKKNLRILSHKQSLIGNKIYEKIKDKKFKNIYDYSIKLDILNQIKHIKKLLKNYFLLNCKVERVLDPDKNKIIYKNVELENDLSHKDDNNIKKSDIRKFKSLYYSEIKCFIEKIITEINKINKLNQRKIKQERDFKVTNNKIVIE